MTLDEATALPPGSGWAEGPVRYRWTGSELYRLHHTGPDDPAPFVVLLLRRSGTFTAYDEGALAAVAGPPREVRTPWTRMAALRTARYLERLP